MTRSNNRNYAVEGAVVSLVNTKRNSSYVIARVRKHADGNLAFDCNERTDEKTGETIYDTVVYEHGQWCPRINRAVIVDNTSAHHHPVSLITVARFASAFTKAAEVSEEDDWSERVDDDRSGMWTFEEEEEAEERYEASLYDNADLDE